MVIAPVVSIAKARQIKLITIENKPRVKKLMGQVKNCKTGLIKKLIKAKTNRNIPNGKKSPTLICGTKKDNSLMERKDNIHVIIILIITVIV